MITRHRPVDTATIRGFTLIELMITIALAAIVMAIAIPNLRDFSRNNRLAGTANDLLRSVQFARNEAIKRQQTVVVCASNNPLDPANANCSYGLFSGWIVFQDTNSSWSREAGEPLIESHGTINPAIDVRNNNDGIVSFARTGFANPPAARTPSSRVVLCDERGNQALGTNSTARTLIVEPTGRARVSSTFADVTAATALAGACP